MVQKTGSQVRCRRGWDQMTEAEKKAWKKSKHAEAKELTAAEADRLVEDNFGVNCFLFLGEGNDHEALMELAAHLRTTHPELELALYSGRQEVEEEIYEAFDFVKVGPYVEALGPLSEASTNQRMYYHREDITSRFWHKHR